ncbi:trimethylamine methyltransferase family protein [Paralimibaculum aggregatum]|uniref:Methyltransferase n=1 Tax=Paralimibaculum aggregatum TaxID=3036245 RepID=A0ABQ6LLU0_9RHOB|nr:trimethylamine methyltransferase family protein [Limibaculum sp. NKW23]GMG83937.1 trimethylamine methyltransferase family protein [Limibaculum sp. NKW23]
MARRARATRGRPPEGAAPASPHVARRLPFFEVLDDEQIARLEAQVDWILEDVGIAFRDDPEALRLWRAEGARIEGDTVRAPADWIRALCAKAPRQFTQLARNPARSVEIGGTSQVFAPVYGPPFVRDLEGGRRYGDIAAFRDLVRLTYMLPSLHHGGFVTCEPCDVPVSKRHLDMLLAHMTLSDKPHLGAITEIGRAEDSVAMAEIVFGAETMAEHCVILGNVNTNSPLLVDKVVTEAVRVYCGRGQGIIVVPFILSGAMGPVSTAASVAQAMAEAMMVCAYAQLVRPGAPFVLGNFLSSMSLKSGAPTFGMPEPVVSNYAIGQLARRVGLPLRCGGSLTAAKIEDAQAAYESADSMHSTMLAGAGFVLHAAGWLEGGLCTGFEKLVMDADRLGGYQKVLAGGLDTSDEALARDAYAEVGPGGHFLGCGHTMRNYQTAFYEPRLSDSENVESWEEGGAQDMRRRAHARWTQMLRDYVPPPIDPAVREALEAYVARRKAELPDAWY